jgi:hypothetical protein
MGNVAGKQNELLAIRAGDGFAVRAVWTEVYQGNYHNHTGPAHCKGARTNVVITQLSHRCMRGA